MAIGQEKGGTWWKVLLGVLGGFFLGIGTVAGGVAIAGSVVKTGTLLGDNADKILSKEYQEKTILQIVMDAVGGKIQVQTLGDLNNITPMVGEYVTGVKNSLNGIGCELTNEEMYTWSLEGLTDHIIGSVKGAKIVRVLSKDNIKYPDPIIKYLSYKTYPEGDPKAGEYVWATDESGEYIFDEDGEHVLIDQHLTDMLDDTNYIQRKVDTMRIKMLFKEEDIKKSSLLTAIQDKSVRELSKDGAFNDVKISAVITVTEDSPKILKTFVANGTTIGGMSDAINDLYLDDVIDLSPSSSPVMKKLLGVSNGTDENPYGPKITSFPANITRMEISGTGKEAKVKTQYDYVMFSDGAGHESNLIPFSEILGTKNSTTGKLDGYNIITIDDTEKGYTLSGAVARDDDEPRTAIHTDKVAIANVVRPDGWGENLYALSCNQKTKVNDLGDTIDDLRLRDAMEIGINDSLWRVRDELVSDGDLISKLVVDDVFEDRSSMKFIKSIPGDTKVTEIGDAINEVSLLEAFEENIFSEKVGGKSALNSTWKYMLIESTEPWISSTPTAPLQEDNPFKVGEVGEYNCANYTIGGDNTKNPKDKGIDGLISNMSANMKRATLQQLNDDGIVTLDHDFLIKEFTGPWAAIAPAGKTTFGELTLEELTAMVTSVS